MLWFGKLYQKINMKMEIKVIVFVIILHLGHSRVANQSLQMKNLYSLRCLIEDTFELCIVFPDENFYDSSNMSVKLIKHYSNLKSIFHEAINKQDFTLIPEETLYKVPDAILMLLPANHLSRINYKVLTNLIIQKSNTKLVKHLVKAFSYGTEFEYLREQIFELPDETLTWIADAFASSSTPPGSKQIITFPPLLFYAPPFSVLFNNTSEKLFYLSIWEKVNSISRKINKSYLRIWTYVMLQNDVPEPLSRWNDLHLGRWGVLLSTATTDELKQLNKTNIKNLQLLFSLGFSPIQVRTLFDGFKEQLEARLNHIHLPNVLINLLPTQLLYFTNKSSFLNQLEALPALKSLATSKQIFNLLQFEIEGNGEKGQAIINKLLYVLPKKNLCEQVKRLEPDVLLTQLQSGHFSKSQLHILPNGNSLLDFNSETIFQCTDFITLLPARDIISNQTASHVLLHLLAHVENIPQSFAVINKLWTNIGTPSSFKKILANRNSKTLLQILPSRHMDKFLPDILDVLKGDNSTHRRIPDSFVSGVLESIKLTENNFSLLNINESLAFLFDGVTCDDISSLDPYEFVIFMMKFNKQRKASEKAFPKTLQQCLINKFLAYIQLKSVLFLRNLGESKLSLLNEAEIDSIGGYIFSALPVSPIARSKYSKNIIKSIGELSLSELMMAAPIQKFEELGSILIDKTIKPKRKIARTLFDLGNLTFFLKSHHLTKINDSFFKLLLESNFVDHRICADKSSRIAWFAVLKRCFGETNYWTAQTLVTLGDFLIVVPIEELNKIPTISWIYAADILNFHYSDDVASTPPLKFYEVCMIQLNSEESQLYLEELTKLVEMLVEASQLQLNTVTSGKWLASKDSLNSITFTYLNSSKENILTSSARSVINANNKKIYKNVGVISTESNLFEIVIDDVIQNSTVPFEESRITTHPFDISFYSYDYSTTNGLGTNFSNDFYTSESSSKRNDISMDFLNITNVTSSTVAFKNENSIITLEPSSTQMYKTTLNCSDCSVTLTSIVQDNSSVVPDVNAFENIMASKVMTTNAYAHKTESFKEATLLDLIQTNKITEGNVNSNKTIHKNKIELLLDNKNAKTEVLNFSYSSVFSKLRKNKPTVTGVVKKTKRSAKKWTCDAFKMVGKAAEMVVTENVIDSMEEEDLNECVDLFSIMDLSKQVQQLIWKKLKLQHLFLSGKLLKSVSISEVRSIDLSIGKPWALETIHLLGKYSTDPEINQHIIKEIVKLENKQQLTVEILVSLGPLICELPQINTPLIQPTELFKAAVILGRSLPCNHTCLYYLSKIAVRAFEDPSKWNVQDVSDLGIIIAGMELNYWKKLIFSTKNPLRGLSEIAFECLPQQHLRELEKSGATKTYKTHSKASFFNITTDFNFFDTELYNHPVQNNSASNSFKPYLYFGCNCQIFLIIIIICLNVL